MSTEGWPPGAPTGPPAPHPQWMSRVARLFKRRSPIR